MVPPQVVAIHFHGINPDRGLMLSEKPITNSASYCIKVKNMPKTKKQIFSGGELRSRSSLTFPQCWTHFSNQHSFSSLTDEGKTLISKWSMLAACHYSLIWLAAYLCSLIWVLGMGWNLFYDSTWNNSKRTGLMPFVKKKKNSHTDTIQLLWWVNLF